jgi:MoaA/NifB/PqqE/SkfB family radical SAM enzyme
MINGRHVTSGWHFMKHYFREVRPYEVTAQLWNVCDQKCVYCRCPAVSTATLTTAQWCEALRGLAKLGTLRVKFQGGEPTLRPDFRDISQAARGAGMLTATVTNGRASAADPRLLDFMDEVVVSLDSLRPEVNDRQRGTGAFAAATRTIDIALERRLKTYVNMALTRHNLEDLEAMLEFCERKGMKMNAQSIKFGVLYYDEAARQMALTPDQIRDVHRKLAEWSRQRRAVLFSARAYRKVLSWPDPCVNTVQSQGYSQCVAGDCYVHINPNGDVVPCIPATTGITPKNIVKDGLTEALKHTRRHHCGDCWSAYLNERKLLFGLHPAALVEFLRRG